MLHRVTYHHRRLYHITLRITYRVSYRVRHADGVLIMRGAVEHADLCIMHYTYTHIHIYVYV